MKFVLSEEAGAPELHKDAVRTAGFDYNIRTLTFTRPPLLARITPYVENWETERRWGAGLVQFIGASYVDCRDKPLVSGRRRTFPRAMRLSWKLAFLSSAASASLPLPLGAVSPPIF
ncbi:hypothetical protein QBC33DRAFT_564056 [Phialemonium atrogriseum]|uniref:Uncharacterized protein n=1 Tax=Phialemonium atrogriseum TaxID=1093897 RepID=A0AAJ0FCH8_9PEZI|nr:uncharacterized protein QBC33DRAFT_564056 [Phialemonium atrogriseum]KAK1762132.1 hypothetical protein QBC33DRAFT_564056 [Phialemonium atrogriseum]